MNYAGAHEPVNYCPKDRRRTTDRRASNVDVEEKVVVVVGANVAEQGSLQLILRFAEISACTACLMDAAKTLGRCLGPGVSHDRAVRHLSSGFLPAGADPL